MSTISVAGIPVSHSFKYPEFLNHLEQYVADTNPLSLPDEEKKHYDFTKLNMQRMRRVAKTYTPSEEMSSVISKIKGNQTWVFITEGWCGDSAQTLPAIAKITAANSSVSLVIIERDDNLEVMNNYLTNGTKSIPILVVFDEQQKELFKWGPRPTEARELIARLKSEGMEHDAFIEQLHLWYAKNKSRSLEAELLALLKQI